MGLAPHDNEITVVIFSRSRLTAGKNFLPEFAGTYRVSEFLSTRSGNPLFSPLFGRQTNYSLAESVVRLISIGGCDRPLNRLNRRKRPCREGQAPPGSRAFGAWSGAACIPCADPIGMVFFLGSYQLEVS